MVTTPYFDIPFSLYFASWRTECQPPSFGKPCRLSQSKWLLPNRELPAHRNPPTRIHGLSAEPHCSLIRARRLKAHDARRSSRSGSSGATPIMLTILVVVLLLIALGAMPTWPYSRGWGYYPSSGLGLIVLVLVILLLMGRI